MDISEQTFGGRYFVVAVSTIIVAILMWQLVDRLDREIINAEHAQFELRLSEIRSAILLIQASLVAKDEMASAAKYQDSNPMDWMEPGQDRYLGEMRLTEAEDKPGNWVFDPTQKVMAYLPNALQWRVVDEAFHREWLRYRVAVRWSDSDSQKEKTAIGLRLEPLQQVEWLEN